MKKHVVIIEDDPDILNLLAGCLEAGGYRVTPLAQLESVEELIALQADAFVIDEHLPVTSGHIICIILKSKPETRHLPVILISAYEGLEHTASLCNADAYLLKPFHDYLQVQALLDKVLAVRA